MEHFNLLDSCDASITRGGGHSDVLSFKGYYKFTCLDASGAVKWEDDIYNMVVNTGKQTIMTGYLTNAAQGAVVMGLVGNNGSSTTTIALTDTQASHTGWYEVGAANAPAYSGTRKTPAFGTATSSGSTTTIATSATVTFSMTSSGTVTGAFINVGGTSAIDNTTGTLFSAGTFTGGSKSVNSGDTLNVSYQLSC